MIWFNYAQYNIFDLRKYKVEDFKILWSKQINKSSKKIDQNLEICRILCIPLDKFVARLDECFDKKKVTIKLTKKNYLLNINIGILRNDFVSISNSSLKSDIHLCKVIYDMAWIDFHKRKLGSSILNENINIAQNDFNDFIEDKLFDSAFTETINYIPRDHNIISYLKEDNCNEIQCIEFLPKNKINFMDLQAVLYNIIILGTIFQFHTQSGIVFCLNCLCLQLISKKIKKCIFLTSHTSDKKKINDFFSSNEDNNTSELINLDFHKMVNENAKLQLNNDDYVILVLRNQTLTIQQKDWLLKQNITHRYVVTSSANNYSFFCNSWLFAYKSENSIKQLNNLASEGVFYDSEYNSIDLTVGYDINIHSKTVDYLIIPIGIEKLFYNQIGFSNLSPNKRETFWKYILISYTSTLLKYKTKLANKIRKLSRQIDDCEQLLLQYDQQIDIISENNLKGSIWKQITKKQELNENIIRHYKVQLETQKKRMERFNSFDDSYTDNCSIGKEPITHLVLCDSDCTYQFQNLIYWLISGGRTCPLTRKELNPQSLYGDDLQELIRINTDVFLTDEIKYFVYNNTDCKKMLLSIKSTGLDCKIVHLERYLESVDDTCDDTKCFCLNVEYNRIFPYVMNIKPIKFEGYVFESKTIYGDINCEK